MYLHYQQRRSHHFLLWGWHKRFIFR
uniref:Uncharacterized protein n=1 Tax=Arundo donax TaxID=35708 RepID=A0A0A9TA26_ARUDO